MSLPGVHLRAHLATRAVLTDHQRHEYDQMRGYELSPRTDPEHGHREHPGS